MDQAREQRIRHRAYELWLDAGKPEGSHLRMWKEAEQQIVEIEAASTDLTEKPSRDHANQHSEPVKDVKKAKAARAQDSSTKQDAELDEGLNESFPGSDAPSSTRRSSSDQK